MISDPLGCDPPDTPEVESLDGRDGYLPARMINEWVYCPRLFYLMHVEGQFAHNAETAEGLHIHRRVDASQDPLPSPLSPSKPCTPKALDHAHEELGPEGFAKLDDQRISAPPQLSSEAESPTTSTTLVPSPSDTPIHARSVLLGSDRLGVVAKLDLVEADGARCTPVDYKRGRPRRLSDGRLAAWKPERVQIALQALILRENGFQCDEGILYFHSTRQRVVVPIDETLIVETERAVRRARKTAEQSQPPPPLVDSPKCMKCSLSPICLPDETNRCRTPVTSRKSQAPVRLPATPRDELRPLYLNTQGLYVGKTGELLVVKDEGKVVQEVRLREINQVNLYGNIQVSTQCLQTLLELEVPLVLHSQHGYFHGMLQGTGLKNILLRREQFRLADQPEPSLRIAKSLIAAKIRNQRVLLMRNHVSPDPNILAAMKRMVGRVAKATTSEELLGIEGTSARYYFQQFAGMLKPGAAPLDPLLAGGEGPKFPFDFRGRNRRPPRDPVNALLSLAYSLLAKDLTVIAASVGLDPYLGFYHQPRPGRPALALDLMEPFRPLIADSVVVTAINNRMVYPEHVVAAGQGVTLTSAGRKAMFRAYEQRMDQLVTHPLFDYRVSYRRLLEIQTRLLARVISGEIEEYPTFVSR